LGVGETAQEKITVSMLGSDKSHDIVFSVAGTANELSCSDRTIIDITASDLPEQYQAIDDGTCIRISSAALAADATWSAWTSPSGAYRGQLFSTVGVDNKATELVFLPAAPGKYNLSWCPDSGECIASFYFMSEAEATEQNIKSTFTVENAVIDEAATITVNLENDLSDENFSYHWIVHHWNDSYDVLVDVITTENTLELPMANRDDNYYVYVIADDNKFQLEGGFNSTRSDGLEYIRRNVSPLGNYDTEKEVINIRSPESVNKPTHVVVMIDGDSTRYEWVSDVVHTINAVKGELVRLDMSESTDENSDPFTYSINYMSVDSTYTIDVKRSVDFRVCANDGFQWTYAQNPCVQFELIVTE